MPAMGGMNGGGGGGPTTHQVTMQGASFVPSSITINRGDTVEWHNDADPHTVTSNPGTLGCSPASAENFAFGTASSPLAANACGAACSTRAVPSPTTAKSAAARCREPFTSIRSSR